ncbi:coiled-coil domain-containing protein [Agathobacter sp. LCP21S3_B2]|uniref:coiled-coil domain-containing protein n=1 Tax=Agathobacter sp. LCP21S3_B2 TaxID=3438734 RepID=UPI003F9304CE
MLIKSIYIRDGLFERNITMEDGVNLIFSKKNSRGKTTLVRLMLYALGYSVPSTKKIKFEKCFTKIEIVLDTGNTVFLTRENSYSISLLCDGVEEIYVLPEQICTLHSKLFNTDNIDILNNVLGAFYFDQEKGWTLLNRGVVIGSIHFNIDELVRGISGKDCSELIAREKRISSDLSKYRQMFSIAQYRDSVSGDSLTADTYQEKKNVELEQLRMRQSSVEREIRRINQSITGNKKFQEFVADMKLLIKTEDGQCITVTKDNIVGLNDSIELLVAKKKILSCELAEIVSKIDKIMREQEKENGQISFFESESIVEAFDKKIVAIPMNQVAIKNEIDKLEKEQKQVREQIAKISRSDNDVVLSLYNTIVKYATELGIGDSESITQKYLFTSNLKELTGAVLHKTVFAFKMAYILELEKHLKIKLPIILDSPSGKEVDQENIELMMNILKRDFQENQIIIASIYDYSFSKVNKVELVDQLLNQMIAVENADENS